MEFAPWLQALIMGVVEGLTEFLPISSTGHLILTASLVGMTGEVAKVFEIAIQTGAMLAVVWEYRVKLGATVRGIAHDPVAQRFATNVFIGCVPAVVLGLLFNKAIKAQLFHPIPVAVAFIVGAILILVVERSHRRRFGANDAEGAQAARVASVDDITRLDAFKVGLVQCLALVPGMSRSGSTIIGAMVFGFSRKAAAEFSFFLGIPILMGAGAYSVWKQRDILSLSDVPMFLVGLVTAFLSALVCIRWLIRYVSSHDFTVFAWYRIVFGVLVLWTAYAGLVDWRA